MQRVLLCRAIISEPKLLILDEHTAALDPKSAETVMELTDKLVKSHDMTAVMVTHNLRFATNYGSRLVMMHNGGIVIAQMRKAAKGDTKAAKFVADLLGELVEQQAQGGVLLDLGVSSPQLDDAERGFSYMADAPLDMRMNGEDHMTARDVVNTWSYEELRRILYDYGEERYAPQIAAAICRRREVSPIETTLELVDIIRSAMPPAALREKQHPAKRSFQAIRIAVNDELGSVEKVMVDAIPCLNPGGRLAIITFHSLEDRIVKNGMANAAKGCTCPPNFPVCVCGNKPKVKLISRKPIVASDEELEVNPRSRSAKLRVCEKI